MVHGRNARGMAVHAGNTVRTSDAAAAPRPRRRIAQEEHGMSHTAARLEDGWPRDGALAESSAHHLRPGLDLSHGTILYVEGVTVSFDGFKALNDLNVYVE